MRALSPPLGTYTFAMYSLCVMSSSGRTTLTLSRKTIDRLRRLKEELGVDSYDELINLLIEERKRNLIERILRSTILTEDEAREIWKVIREGRETWWKRSY